MAEGILLELANSLLGRLITYAEQEIMMLGSVNDQHRKLRRTASRIQAVLRDADQQQTLNHQDQDWVEKLKEVISDGEDLLDDFATEAEKKEVMCSNKVTKEVCLFFSCSNQLIYGHNLGKKLESIISRLNEIVEDKEKFALPVDARSKVMDATVSLLPEVVIGRKADKQAIIDRLLGPENEEKVIPIVGLGGMGKTTLAQLVFNDKKVGNNFELKLWVSVPRSFDLKLILQKILESITKKDPGDLDPNNLSELINEKLGGKKYLLVLDDVWNEDENTWDNLERTLKCGKSGSKIILTTRLERVAQFPRTKKHRLGELSSFESWDLLKQLAFYKGNVPTNSESLSQIGKEIASNCLGVPLVIRVVGRFLHGKRPDEWLSFKENELSTIAQNEGDVSDRLKLSYNHLPLSLKSCFSYCCLFPKGYEINIETLVQLWIAQGLVSFVGKPKPYEELEDVGRKIFEDLWWRSFFQEVKRDMLGNPISCKMHDLMHDLATSVASRQTIILKSNGDNVPGNTYHVSFDFNVDTSWQISSNLCKAKKLRTLLLPKQKLKSNDEGMSDSNFEAICSNFERLRVLDLHDLGINHVSSSIKKLKYLRYLDASRNDRIESLPVSITRLQNLAVLNLFGCTQLKELPRHIIKLINLVCLDCKGCWNLSHMPLGLGRLTSLQTLSWFVVSKNNIDSKHVGGLEELGKLNKLRIVEIRNLRFVGEAKLAALAKLQEKHHLCSLTLSWNIEIEDLDVYNDYEQRSGNYMGHDNVGGDNDVGINQEILESLKPNKKLKQLRVYEFDGMNFPNWLSSIINVVEIWIVNCKRLKHLPPLDELPFLRDLWLSELIDLIYIDGRERTISNGSFPSLKLLRIWRCPYLKRWWKNGNEGCDLDGTTTTSAVELPEFPCLSTLDIRGCPNMKWMPEFSYSNGTLLFHEVNLSRLQRVSPPGKVGFLNCLTSFSNAVEIEVVNCKGCRFFPPLDQLHSLVRICIESVEDLVYIGIVAIDERQKFFPSLQTLSIESCPKFKGWWKARNDDDEIGDIIADELPQFPCLSGLTISDCPQLIHLPCFPTLVDHLTLIRTSCTEAFKQTVDVCISSCQLGDSGVSTTSGLANLRFLHLCELDDLEYIGIENPAFMKRVIIEDCKNLKNWIKNEAKALRFPALSGLDICHCPNLEFINIEAMPFLEWLFIAGCTNLKVFGKEQEYDNCGVAVVTEAELASFPCVSELSMIRCPRLSSMPLFQSVEGSLRWKDTNIEPLEKLMNVTSSSSSLPTHPLSKLKSLLIEDMMDIESLPSVHRLKSLRYLWLSNCPKLKCLPEGVNHLCLMELSVRRCPMVTERCEKGKGVDWPTIANIPNIEIDDSYIQRKVRR